jgi:hypothetical protein
MPRLVHRKPRYRKHKASGLAVVTICGVDRYLGKYGTAESRATYRQLIAESEASASNGPAGHVTDDLTIVELIARYLRFRGRLTWSSSVYWVRESPLPHHFTVRRRAVRGRS